MTTENYEALLDIVKQRRSIRRFKADPIPDDTINKIIEVAKWAPSGFNTQPWEVVILKDKADRQKIVDVTAYYWDQSVVMERSRPDWQGKKWELKGMTDEPGDYTQAPVYILLFGDQRALDALPMGVQSDKNRRQLIYQSSLSNLFLYMMTAASTLGLATQWYSVVQVPYCAVQIKEYLGIPQHFDVFDMMILGYPDATPPKKFLRKTDDFCQWGVADESTHRTDEEVKDFAKKTRAWVMGMHAKKAASDD